MRDRKQDYYNSDKDLLHPHNQWKKKKKKGEEGMERKKLKREEGKKGRELPRSWFEENEKIGSEKKKKKFQRDIDLRK